jgi:hypothetical protein
MLNYSNSILRSGGSDRTIPTGASLIGELLLLLSWLEDLETAH